MQKIREKLSEYRRVIAVATKPSKEEFLISTKVCAAGVLLIGFIGFIIYLIYISTLAGV
jgi:protein transport protein SEC61 subunit gamma-like protein